MPGHGPVCGLDGVREMRAYLESLRDESRRCFDAGLTSLEAAKRIDYGPYGEWRAPARLYMNVERAYREFGAEPADAPWNQLASCDAIYRGGEGQGRPRRVLTARRAAHEGLGVFVDSSNLGRARGRHRTSGIGRRSHPSPHPAVTYLGGGIAGPCWRDY